MKVSVQPKTKTRPRQIRTLRLNDLCKLFGSGGGEKTARTAGIKFLGKIPFDLDVVACGDSGTSFQKKNKDSLVTKAFANIADLLSINI